MQYQIMFIDMPRLRLQYPIHHFLINKSENRESTLRVNHYSAGLLAPKLLIIETTPINYAHGKQTFGRGNHNLTVHNQRSVAL